MSDQKEVVAETTTTDELDYKSMYESSLSELEKIKANHEKLMDETKAAKRAKADQEAERAKLEKEKAQKDGEFEKLFQMAEKQRKELEDQLNSERTQYKQDKINTHAMKLAVELADGDASSAKLLSKFLSERLTHLSDEKGSLDNDVLVAVTKEFKQNPDYAPLLAGSKANGGGAPGNTGSGAAVVDLSKLSPVERMNAARENK